MEFRMAIQVKDNFLNDQEFEEIKNNIMGNNFPWFFYDYITNDNDHIDNFYFIHNIFRQPSLVSGWFELFNNFLEKIEYKSLLRIKANLYLKTKNKVIHKPHKDYYYEHKGCILYINDNNGETFFGKEKVKPKANRIVFFNPNEEHSSSTCTDQQRRVNINFNYF